MGKTALHFAGEQNQKGFVALLIDNGSDPDAINTSGKTALHYDAAQGFDEVTSCLLKVTDASIVDKSGGTATSECKLNTGRSFWVIAREA